MPVLLSTRDVEERHRRDAILTTVQETCGRTDITLENTGGPVSAQLEFWPLGTAVHTFSFHGTGMRMTQTARHVRLGAPEQFSLSIHENATGRTRAPGVERRLGHGDVMLMDQTDEYDYHRIGDGGTRALGFDITALDISVDQLRRANREFLTNPLLGLVRQHITYVLQNAEQLSMSPAAAAIGTASADLARAFILAAQGDTGRREALHETLLARLTAYVRAHLTDADLTPARIAAHHNISVRHLHTVWSHGTGSTLEQWIMMERLAGARDQLATGRSITALAHAWGFTDASHFTRRFRQAFGVAPRDWRREQ
ncbi:helix-turn-helix transcriptional regulator [Streptomyces sp. NPDC091972]|uniref:helix-turn-helix transcriptional regulator n=1 Tax=unclassified Streptomyces TaxID=2593676 RepID=UPI003429FDB8